jgi:hypothetical protein
MAELGLRQVRTIELNLSRFQFPRRLRHDGSMNTDSPDFLDFRTEPSSWPAPNRQGATWHSVDWSCRTPRVFGLELEPWS